MTQSTDFTAKAQAAFEKIADRLPELPRPVLAAIGAADLAGRQLVELVGKLGDKTGVKAPSLPDTDDVVTELRATAADLPGKLQKIAGDLPQKTQDLLAELPAKAKELADELEEFATGLPGKVQKFSDDLPEKVSEVGAQLQPEQVKQSADAYRQLISGVYASLAERGGHTWEGLRNSGPIPGSVVDAPAESAAPAAQDDQDAAPAQPAAKRPARRKPTPKSETEAAATDTAAKDTAPKDATEKDTAAKDATVKAAPAGDDDTDGPADATDGAN